jgi:DNA polymerase III delta prime subunit
VFFEERNHVKDRVNFFLTRRDWYDAKGIPYTLGFLFHGPPGVGKTSTIKAIANEGKRHIINVQLSEIKTKAQLHHLFFNDEVHVWNGVQSEKYTIPVSERLYVIEDIDAMGDTVLRREWKKPTPASTKPKEEDVFLNREKEEKDTIDLAFILNLLDGTLEANGRILAITTNFPERIDRALIRPGRIDMIVNFKKCNLAVVQEMVRSFYDSDTVVSDESLNYKWSPAEVNQILFRNFGDVTAGVAELIGLKASQDGDAGDQSVE